MENNLISKKTFAIPVLALQNGKRIKFKQNSYEIIHLDSEEAISDSVEYFSIWDSFFIFDLDLFLRFITLFTIFILYHIYFILSRVF